MPPTRSSNIFSMLFIISDVTDISIFFMQTFSNVAPANIVDLWPDDDDLPVIEGDPAVVGHVAVHHWHAHVDQDTPVIEQKKRRSI